MQPYGISLLERFPQWWLLLLLAFGVSAALTGILYKLAITRQILPAIRERDVHTVRKPRIGGVAMWLSVLAFITFISMAPGVLPGQIELEGPTLAGLSRPLLSVLIGMTVLLVFGVVDDVKGLKPWQQLVGQVLAGLAVVWGGLIVTFIRSPFGGELHFDGASFVLPSWLGGGQIWYVAAFFSLFWIVAMINVMNFFDGLDGLAGSIAVTGSTVLFFVCLRLGFTSAATLALLVAAVAGGFLVWNWHPSKLFMGTVGSQLLGFLLAVIALVSGAKVATAVLVLGIPLLDALVVIGRRLLAGASPFEADQRHLHHRLLTLGLSIPVVVVMINLIALAFGLLALRTQNAAGKGMLSLILIGCMALFIAATYLLERRASKRVD